MQSTSIRRTLGWLLAAGLIIAAGVLYWHWRARPVPPHYVTATVDRGPVVSTIITTGTVNPVITVQVGSYVSGPIKALYCDYNTKVKAGQLCAKIDPRTYQLAVDQAVANLTNAKAQLQKDNASLVYARINFERDSKLLKEGIVSQDTVDNDTSVLDQAKAQIGLDQSVVEQRDAALNASRVSLDYTNIISPVDGVVVSRNVDVGQTVAASFQTPTLFLIAKDLTKMQVDTNVSESDVSGARVGEKASFTVEAYPNETFWGTVSQVRRAPITVQNVVTYDVVVSVDNPKLQLLPGMTANARIITRERDDVMRVPLPALRFLPEGLAGAKARSDAQAPGARSGAGVWVLRGGEPHRVPVTTGLNDGAFVEITGGDLKVGDPVIVNEVRPGQDASQQRSLLRF